MAEQRNPRSHIDDPLLARLDRLAERQGATRPASSAGRPLAPPTRGPAHPPGPPFLQPQPAPRPPAPATKPVRTKRRHPARSARIGALAVSCATTGGLSFLFATSGTSSAGAGALPSSIATVAPAVSPVSPAAATTVPVVPAPAATTVTAPTAPTAAATIPATTVAPAVVPAASQPAAFDGNVVNTRYGPVQVQIQVANGALTDVAVVLYPDGDRKSIRINEQALPTLRSEALTAQSARVHTVSGATYTSDGYTQSLQSALDAARAAGITVNA